jgi:low temperature requirement protein LtrA
MAVVKMRDKEQDIALKKILAWASVAFVAFQLIIANLFFGFYLWHARETTPNSIMMAWLSATVIEVIAILGIIARSLFPGRKNRKPLDPPAV